MRDWQVVGRSWKKGTNELVGADRLDEDSSKASWREVGARYGVDVASVRAGEFRTGDEGDDRRRSSSSSSCSLSGSARSGKIMEDWTFAWRKLWPEMLRSARVCKEEQMRPE